MEQAVHHNMSFRKHPSGVLTASDLSNEGVREAWGFDHQPNKPVNLLQVVVVQFPQR